MKVEYRIVNSFRKKSGNFREGLELQKKSFLGWRTLYFEFILDEEIRKISTIYSEHENNEFDYFLERKRSLRQKLERLIHHYLGKKEDLGTFDKNGYKIN